MDGEHVAAYGQHMKRRGYTEGTITGRLGALRGFARWLDPRSLLDATSEDIDLFLDGRKGRPGGHIETRTRYGWVSGLHRFYEWAIIHELTDCDPTRRIDRPKLHKLLPRPILEADLAVALECADRMMFAWLMLGAFAGLRCMEVAAFDVDWLLRADGLLRILGKGGKERLVPVHPHLLDALDDWRLPKRGPVFVRPRGGRYPASVVSKEGNYYLTGLGIPATMHMTRHRFGTQFYATTRDIRLTQEVMGHSSIQTTAGYVAYNQAEVRDGILALPTFQREMAGAD